MASASRSLFERPLFWLIFSTCALACILFSYHYFPRTFPLANITISMDRDAALKAGTERAHNNSWGPQDAHTAVSFESDYATQCFIELEAGGHDAFMKVIEEKFFRPYTWHVRLFQEQEAHEATVIFAPDGTPYGFKEKVAETAPGPHLSEQQARKHAEQGVQEQWPIDLSMYELVQASHEVQQNGRADYTFVYEMPNKKIGDGTYRLQLVVTGDRLTEVKPFIKVPESFVRKYEEMRSANQSIALAGMVIFYLLYLLGGCVIGLFFLIRRRWLITTPAYAWGVGLAVAEALTMLNQLPLLWMYYNTSQTTKTFLFSLAVQILRSLFSNALVYSISILAAESLTRKAFGHLPQFWRIWSDKARSSLTIFGTTLGGYLVVGFDLAFVVIFYGFTLSKLGWWSPTQSLFNPNVLATYVPWFSAAANALRAGFWEECIFRAVPLSIAALIGKRYNKEKLFLGIGFIFQAVVFAAAHANYAAQPAYARLVELILPSFFFGYLYIRFGLHTAIISHVIYDLVLMSLPLFVSSAPNAWVHQVIIILLGSLPLLITLLSRLQAGSFTKLPEALYNYAWQAPQKIIQKARKKLTPLTTLPRNALLTTLALGLLGGGAWLWYTPFMQQAQQLSMPRQEAIERAQQELSKRDITLGASWQTVATIRDEGFNPDLFDQQRFVWQLDKKLYHQLSGNYLWLPYWLVRYVQFDGAEVAERAEEYRVVIGHDGVVRRFYHQLPEGRPGAQLTKEQARKRAHTALDNILGIAPDTLKEVSAVDAQHPQRKDWLFTFEEPGLLPAQSGGQARISVTISGDEISDAYRHVYVPEEWRRQEEERKGILETLFGLCALLLKILLLFAAGRALVTWSSQQFSARHFTHIFVLLTMLSITILGIMLPTLIANFTTSTPYSTQLITLIAGALIAIFISNSVIALVSGFQATKTTIPFFEKALVGLSCASTIAGALAVVNYYGPSLKPLWASYTAGATYLPLLTPTLSLLLTLIKHVASISILIQALNYLTNYGREKKITAALYVTIFGFTLMGLVDIDSLATWALSGAVMSILAVALYLLTLRYSTTIIPIMVAGLLSSDAIQQALFNAYHHAAEGYALAIILCLGTGMYFARWQEE